MNATPCLSWLPARPQMNQPARCENGRRVWLIAGNVRTLTQRPATVRCLSGEVWLTQTGGREDIVLESGQSFVCQREGQIVAQGLTDAMLCVVD